MGHNHTVRPGGANTTFLGNCVSLPLHQLVDLPSQLGHLSSVGHSLLVEGLSHSNHGAPLARQRCISLCRRAAAHWTGDVTEVTIAGRRTLAVVDSSQ